MVAIDSSKFKAVNNSDRAFSKVKIKRRREMIDVSIDKYLEEINKADRQALEKPYNSWPREHPKHDCSPLL